MALRQPAALDMLEAPRRPDLTEPGVGEVTVRLRASSRNFHDYMVATGVVPTEEGRIPPSAGAGEIGAIGARVTEFSIGDSVMSTSFPG
jgi:NADPH:quinone reductase-like Zn-dependent oxidoreductase